jgi:HAD superfamily hydrolase (TIGR01484 family)
MNKKIKIVFSDLDGTLLNNSHILSQVNRKTLMELKKRGIIRVVATGRSLFSAQKVMDLDFPIDYLIFSSGAGIMNWHNQESIYKEYMQKNGL